MSRFIVIRQIGFIQSISSALPNERKSECKTVRHDTSCSSRLARIDLFNHASTIVSLMESGHRISFFHRQ